MGRHHQQSRRSGYVAHLALGAATVAGLLGGGGVAVALQAAPSAPAAPVFPTTAPAAATPVVAPVCDLSGPPEFGDPARPNVITNRTCGYVDSEGQERSRDRWIDDQLVDAAN